MAALLELRPGIVWNNRLCRGIKGCFATPEQRIPDTGLDYDWETCMTINGTWGYKSYDHSWKSTDRLIRNLVDIASKGGNFLLNVGPTDEGLIPEPSVKRLVEIGPGLGLHEGQQRLDGVGDYQAVPEVAAAAHRDLVVEQGQGVRTADHDGVGVGAAGSYLRGHPQRAEAFGEGTDHQVRETLQITDRSYVISKGTVLCHGTPNEVLSHAEAREKYFGDGIDIGSPGPPPPHGPLAGKQRRSTTTEPRRRRSDLE